MKLDTKVVDGRELIKSQEKRLKQMDLIIFVINIVIFFVFTIEKIQTIQIFRHD